MSVVAGEDQIWAVEERVGGRGIWQSRSEIIKVTEKRKGRSWHEMAWGHTFQKLKIPYSILAALTKYHRLADLNNKHFFLTVLEA